MEFRFYKFTVLLLITSLYITAFGKTQTNEVVNMVEQSIHKYFSKEYNIPSQSIAVSFKRIPELSDLKNNHQLKLQNPRGKFKTGYQTIWLEVYEKNIFQKKFPVSFSITIKQKVVTAKRKIKPGQKFNDELVDISEQSISCKLGNVYTSLKEIYNLESSRFIKQGAIITRNMVRPVSVLENGDKVEIMMNVGNVSITTTGVAKGYGQIGEKINVICESTGEKLSGIIYSPTLVVVSNYRN